MGAIIHKLCERAEQELWDVLKENKWSKDYAEIAFYLTEIMKGAKKMEHLAKLDEAMEKYDKEEEEERKKMMMEKDTSQFARRGRGGRSNYALFEYEEDEDEGNFRRGRRGNYENQGSSSGSNQGGQSSNYNQGGSSQGGNFTNLPMIPPMYRTPDYMPPMNYTHDPKEKYYEEKYKELLEEKWEKEKKENRTATSAK